MTVGSLVESWKRLSVGLVVSFALTACADPTTGPWQQADGYRWRDLGVSTKGKTGFTLVSADKSGIGFANVVSDSAINTNRILAQGAGVAIGDVDGDGWPDVFFGRTEGRSVLYRNLGNWKFEDITARAGLGEPRIVTGTVLADIDGDDDLDLFLNVLDQPGVLYRNDGKAHFTIDSSYPGESGTPGAVTSTLADVDGDGDLDLFVGHNRRYAVADRYTPEERAIENITERTRIGELVIKPEYRADFRLEDGVGGFGVAIRERPFPSAFYLNDGSGEFAHTPIGNSPRFLDEAGNQLPIQPELYTLAARFYDVNHDGAPDLYVVNDFEDPDQFWINDGKGNFRLIDRLALRNLSRSGMSIDFADINRDGLVDMFEVDMLSLDSRGRLTRSPAQNPPVKQPGVLIDRPQYMRNTMFLGRGDGTFAQIAELAGIDASGWTWSTIFLDVDLDGFEDILVANGSRWDESDYDINIKFQKKLDSLRPQTAGFPSLKQPNYAFRNKGDLTFEELGERWGVSHGPDISHAIATGDLDLDGDLEVVISRLDDPALVLKNNASAPRVAVRLEGRPPNTRAIGAKIRLLGGPVPIQEREVTSGGLYLSHSDHLLTFAAGAADSLYLEVIWRDGKRTVIPNVRPNREYEIQEPATGPVTPPQPRVSPTPLFADASEALNHRHVESPFWGLGETVRQPLLLNSLAALGPGITWDDLDHDGDDDLLITNGQNGSFAWYQNTGGRFTAAEIIKSVKVDLTQALALPLPSGGARLLVGQSSYESLEDGYALPGVIGVDLDPKGRPVGPSKPVVDPDTASVGPLALGDIDGNQTLDLFVGSRVNPGEYPRAAASRIFRQGLDGTFRPDSANARVLADLGMVSSATFSDLDGDDDLDLVLAIEWGPMVVLLNERGTFKRAPASWGFDRLPARWIGVATGDFNGDGRPDIVSTSLGRNVRYVPDTTNPQVVYFGHFDQDFTFDLLLAHYDPRLKGRAPLTTMSKLGLAFRELGRRGMTFQQYADSRVDEILGDGATRVDTLRAVTTEHFLWINRGDHFDPRPLPVEAQFAPAFSPVVADFDGDGRLDLALSQNLSLNDQSDPPFDAGRGLVLLGDGDGTFRALASESSGIVIYGDQRGAAAADYDGDGRTDLAIGQNGSQTKLYRNQTGKPGIRVELVGPTTNPRGIGAKVRMSCGGVTGPLWEIQAGTGHWSSNSPAPIVTRPAGGRCQLEVRWPNGRRAAKEVAPEATVMKIAFDDAS